MIHPTRTNLLMLRDKTRSVGNSMRILKARKQALIKEFLDTSRPFLRTRDDIRKRYEIAIQELALALGHEGRDYIESLIGMTAREFNIDITEKSLWGLRYKEVEAYEPAVRGPEERGYDYLSTSPHVEESAYLFEMLLDAMIGMAAFEGKLKRFGDEIINTTRRIRVLEEKVLPDLRKQVKMISDHIGEREREAYCRLKHFKGKRA
ncbi:MAG: V-type ATP synthase subunit D [Nitrospiraceae bacterium]|nr:V-type ATP synthase subunit D [Nitrospiraceae bacterium]